MKKILILSFMIFCIASCKESNVETKEATTPQEEIKINTIDCETTKEKVASGAVLIDVRTKEEYSEGTLDNAINIPVDNIDSITKEVPDKDTVIIVFCQSGGRSSTASNKLKGLGYKNIYNLGAIDNCKS